VNSLVRQRGEIDVAVNTAATFASAVSSVLPVPASSPTRRFV
jgi:hypothetical protein